MSDPHSQLSLTHEENDLLSIAIEEYNDLFPSIMLLNQHKFIPTLERFVQISLLPKGKTYSSGTLSKILKIIQLKYYEPEYSTVNNLIQSISDIKKCERFTSTNYIPHCDLTKHAFHKCGERMYIIDKYLLCLKCKFIYRSNCVLFQCDHCKIDYYTSLIDKEIGMKYKKITWKQYHCPNFVNDTIKCYKCRNCLYMNNNKQVYCLNCNVEIETHHLKQKCFVCGNDFIPDIKEYNPLELKTLKMVMKQILYDGKEAKPELLPCCHVENKDVQKYKFYHKKECTGILFIGTFNNTKIVVCSKCHKMYNYDSHFWWCPLCKVRFNLGKENNNNANGNIRSSAHKKVKTNLPNQNYSKDKIGYDEMENAPNSAVGSSNHSRMNNDSGSSGIRRRSRGWSSKCPANIEEQLRKTGGIRSFNLIMENNNDQNNKTTSIQLNKHNRGKISTSNDHSSHQTDLDKKLSNININVQAISNMTGSIHDVNSKSPTNSNNNGNSSSNNSNNQNLRKIFIPMGKRRHSSNGGVVASNYAQKSIEQRMQMQQQQQQDKRINAPFSADDYAIINQIGEGTFGKIYQVADRNKNSYAMKKIIANSKEEIDALRKELEMISSLNKLKINLVNIYGLDYKKLDKTTFVLYVLMDLAYRDWEKEINHRKLTKSFYTEDELLHILKELVYTFSELQRNNISHRDIKPQNILLFPDGKFKIADFGEAKEIFSSQRKNTIKQTIRGTELYMSPILFQALQNKDSNMNYTEHNTFKSDVFSLGLCFLLAATLSINALCQIRELTDMLSIKVVLTKYFNRRYSTKFTDVLYKMLEVNEKERCDFIELNQITERF